PAPPSISPRTAPTCPSSSRRAKGWPATAVIPRCCTDTAGSTSASRRTTHPPWPGGSSSAASTRGRTCAAGPNTGKHRTRPGCQFGADEFGSSDDSTAVGYLLAYSPLQNLKAGTCYPATLVTTADHDDRVVPGHSFKFAATLQAAQSCDRPVLLRVETAGSHGYRPTDRVIAEIADEFAFALANLLGRAP